MSTQFDPGVTQVVTAGLGAGVAIFALLITQWITGKRARKELLTKKLEELFLLVVQCKTELFLRESIILKRFGKIPSRLFLASNMDEQRVGSIKFEDARYVTMQMYIRLYFPRLRTTFNAHFWVYQEVVRLFADLAADELERAKTLALLGRYQKTFLDVEYEILENGRLLTNDHVLPVRYKMRPEG